MFYAAISDYNVKARCLETRIVSWVFRSVGIWPSKFQLFVKSSYFHFGVGGTEVAENGTRKIKNRKL